MTERPTERMKETTYFRWVLMKMNYAKYETIKIQFNLQKNHIPNFGQRQTATMPSNENHKIIAAVWWTANIFFLLSFKRICAAYFVCECVCTRIGWTSNGHGENGDEAKGRMAMDQEIPEILKLFGTVFVMHSLVWCAMCVQDRTLKMVNKTNKKFIWHFGLHRSNYTSHVIRTRHLIVMHAVAPIYEKRDEKWEMLK